MIPSNISLGQVGMIGQIGGLLTSTIGGYYSAASQKSALKAQAALADTNARIAELGAQSALAQGQQQVGALTLRAGQLKSTQRANLAANGVDLGEGSAAEVQASTDLMKEIDKNTVEANAVRSAWGYRTQAMNFQNEALTKRATAGGISPIGSAVTSLLSGAGSVASSWYAQSKAGGLGNSGASSTGQGGMGSGYALGSYDYSIGSSKLSSWR
ncbi:MAG: hypothetical protein LBV14_13305 [Acidovorax sp.]|jgi:hypothetical protein|nr:hypothetical protein [Acidovorax sp.]